MISLKLAANLVRVGPFSTSFGHMQLVFDDGVNTPQEIEVKGDGLLAFFLDWVILGPQSHTDPNLTPGFGDSQDYRATTLATGADAVSQWNILVEAHNQFLAAADGQRFQYDLTYNSNTYANTLLSILGYSFSDFENLITAPSITGGFPGSDRNALNDGEYPNDAIDMTLNGGATNDTIITGNGSDTLMGGDGDDDLRGGGGNDSLHGEDGNDVLWGEAGADDMFGGMGNDSFVVDNAGDTIHELLNEGTDTAYAYVNHTLADHVEQGVQLGSASLLNGNALDNVMLAQDGGATLNGLDGHDALYASTGNNTLNGGNGNDLHVSGSGIETMQGGMGDDMYRIGAGDIVVELAGQGNDVVFTGLASYTLTDHVEYGVLEGGTELIGNGLDNALLGDDGANTLSGMSGNDLIGGGAGSDMIQGGLGMDTIQTGADDDTIIYDTIAELGDIILDFISGSDSFSFSRSGFGFSAGDTITLGDNFFIDQLPTGNGPAFIYDSISKALYFDSDGTGASPIQLVADIQDTGSLNAADIELV